MTGSPSLPVDRLKRPIYLTLARLIGRRRHRALPPRDAIRRVLVLRYDRLGDMIVTTPLLEELRRLLPNASLDVLASHSNAALIEGDPRVNRIHRWGTTREERRTTLAQCRNVGYDVVIQTLWTGTKWGAIYAAMTSPNACTVGRYHPRHAPLYDRSVQIDPHLPMAERTLSLLHGLDLEPRLDLPYSLWIPEEERREAAQAAVASGIGRVQPVVLNISAGDRIRELSDEQNIAIVRGITQRLGTIVALCSAPHDGERAERIAAQSGAMLLPATSSMRVLCGMLGYVRCVITPDTSIVHLASAAGAPVVALYHTAENMESWGARGVPSRSLLFEEMQPLAQTVTPDRVIDAAAELVGSEAPL